MDRNNVYFLKQKRMNSGFLNIIQYGNEDYSSGFLAVWTQTRASFHKRCRKILNFICIGIILPFGVLSQGQGNTWIFGDSAGISFYNGIPAAIPSVVNSQSNTSSISDSQGNLLFYNGCPGLGNQSFYTNVWNRLHQVMPNGYNIDGNAASGQGSIIIPFPDDTMQYYIFTSRHEISYSTVDMTLDGGYGDVVLKNVFLHDTNMVGKMNAVRHGNGRDWWLLEHEYGSANFIEYLISDTGISNVIVQNIGATIIYNPFSSAAGQMIFSPSGEKLAFACAAGQLELFDFDRCTGIISNPVSLGDLPYSQYNRFAGCSFSPDESRLYASTYCGYCKDSLFQFDLTAANIKASQTLLYVNSHNQYTTGFHLLAPDGKIYITNTAMNTDSTAYDSLNMHLTVINFPDSLGAACGVAPYSFWLGGKRCYAGLPNMPNYNLGALTGSLCDTLTVIKEIKQNDVIKISPNPATNFIQIKCHSKENQTAKFILSNSLGQVIKIQNLFSNTKTQVINISDLQNGIYFWKIKSQQQNISNGKLAILK